APTYFLYTAPLAVIAGVAATDAAASIEGSTRTAWAMLLLLFAVITINRSYVSWIGIEHMPVRLDAGLELPNAHLNVGEDSALEYRALISLIRSKLGSGRLIAGPDCPEVYFLAGRVNPAGH